MTTPTMAPGWAERMAEAQLEPTIELAGQVFTRVRCGEERGLFGFLDGCGDCGVNAGQFHVPNCSIERCPRCGGQALGCPCSAPASATEHRAYRRPGRTS